MSRPTLNASENIITEKMNADETLRVLFFFFFFNKTFEWSSGSTTGKNIET